MKLSEFSIGDLVEFTNGRRAHVGCIHEDKLYLTQGEVPSGGSNCNEHNTRWICRVLSSGDVSASGYDLLNLKFIKKAATAQPTSMSTLIEKFRTLTASKEEKLFLEHGIENPLGTPTEEGKTLLLEILYRENREKVKAAVTEIAKEEDEKK